MHNWKSISAIIVLLSAAQAHMNNHPIVQAPEPVEPWAETLDAFEYMPTCMHSNHPPYIDNAPQSEDCLALNIFVPSKLTE